MFLSAKIGVEIGVLGGVVHITVLVVAVGGNADLVGELAGCACAIERTSSLAEIEILHIAVGVRYFSLVHITSSVAARALGSGETKVQFAGSGHDWRGDGEENGQKLGLHFEARGRSSAGEEST